MGDRERAAVPWRFRLAGAVRRLPEFRGRDRLFAAALGGTPPPAGRVDIGFGPGLVLDADLREDGSFCDLYFAQYEVPALVPLLEAALSPGGCFVDVGANIGVYSAWAAKLVGSAGVVHAFEPVPRTRGHLERMIAMNRLANVRVDPSAVGSAPGTTTLHLVACASGLASALPDPERPAETITVPVTTLDVHARTRSDFRPSLVKIDVEGWEFEVLKGARGVLRGEAGCAPPPVVLETQATHLARAGVGFDEMIGWLEREAGYGVFALRGRGPRRHDRRDRAPVSSNSLAAHPDHHRTLLERLARVRFRRNQTC